MTAPDPRLGEIEARAAAATPGPWESGRGATSDGTEFVTTYEQKSAFLALSLNSGRSCLWLVDNGEVIPAVTGDGPRAQANADASVTPDFTGYKSSSLSTNLVRAAVTAAKGDGEL